MVEHKRHNLGSPPLHSPIRQTLEVHRWEGKDIVGVVQQLRPLDLDDLSVPQEQRIVLTRHEDPHGRYYAHAKGL